MRTPYSAQPGLNQRPFEDCVMEMRGVEPRTFRMQSGRATTVPHPRTTDEPQNIINKAACFSPTDPWQQT